jgi:haloacetate dehalogenase
MFEGFTSFDINVQSQTIHGTRKGTGPPLLLLHGFPETHHMWHLVTPHLDAYTTILLDLPGYGESSRPSSTNANFAKSAMARSCHEAMLALGFNEYSIVAHDRGARVAHKLAVDYPACVRRVLLLDICPTLAMFEATNAEFARLYWHWFFMTQEPPFPERMIRAGLDVFLQKCLGIGGGFVAGEALEVYEAAARAPGSVEAWCADYRAAATVDLEEARQDIAEGRQITCPLRVLWGKKGVVEKCFDALTEWKKVHATGEVSGEAVDSGHFIPEEAPDVVVKHIKEFLV